MSVKGFPFGMRQMEEKHVPNQVGLMVWSNRLDLLALSNVKGEVQVHRLHWQKVVNLPPPKENVTVRALAWRPDGKAIAIGYSSGSVHIVEIEDKKILHQYDLEKEPSEEFSGTHHGITCITWAVKNGVGDGTEYNVYDDSSIFLQKLQPAGSSSGYKSQTREDTVKELKETQDPTQLNMLLVGYGTGHIYMSVYGRYLYGTIHLTEIVKDDCGEYNILDINLSDDFSVLQVFYVDRMSNNSFLALLNTSVLSAYSSEIFSVANRHGHIIQLLSHLDNTMTSITEAWEHILLEMDTKMAYYAASVPEGGVSADLLELLMLGAPSDELELFLLQELTTKGLKKVGNSVELSYSTIQKLVLNQLNIVGQNLAYHLSELRGLTRIPDRYQILGIEESQVTEAIKSCCAFLNKCLELQQVIDTSMRNYKAFFRWLYVVMNRLLDEQIPTEIAKMAQQDLTHIAEFLYNFDNVEHPRGLSNLSEKPVKFNLERLGQYLQDQDLTILPDDEGNPWQTFLNENPCLVRDDNNDTVFSMAPFKKFSLVQQQNYLRRSIQKLFNSTEKDASKHFSLLSNMNCTDYKISAKYRNHIKVTQTFSESDDTFMTAFMNKTDVNTDIFFLSVCTKTKEGKQGNVIAHKFNFSSCFLRDADQSTSDIEENLPILDMQFYSPEYLSVIVRHPHSQEDTVFIQLPINKALENSEKCVVISNSSVFNDNTQKKNLSPLLEQNVYKVLDKMDGYRIAVSGGRKVAVVLSKSLRKVRVFEMEVDAEDEDETLTSPDLKAKSENTLTPEKDNIMLL